MRKLTHATLAAGLLLLTACASSAQQAKQMAPNEVVATVGKTSITLGEVDTLAMQAPASSFGGARLVQALYLARRAALEDIIGKRLMDDEAKARGIDRASLVEKEIADKAPTPTAADIDFWPEQPGEGARRDAGSGPRTDPIAAHRRADGRRARVPSHR
jgi:hypothetical protein